MLSRIIASVRYCHDGVKGVRFCHGGGVKGTKSEVIAELTPSSLRIEVGMTCPSKVSCPSHCQQSNPKPTKRSSSAQVPPKMQYRKFDTQTSNLRSLILDKFCVDSYFAHVNSRRGGGKCERGYMSGLVNEINVKAPSLDITYNDVYNRIGKIKRQRNTTSKGGQISVNISLED